MQMKRITGVNIKRLRTTILLLTGIMTALSTSFCGCEHKTSAKDKLHEPFAAQKFEYFEKW